MSSVIRFISTASCIAAAAAAVLDLPIIVDNGYKVVEVEIGTPAKTYRLLFDTGSASSWVVDATCAANCANSSGYNRVGYSVDSSSTAKLTGVSAEIDYLGGAVAGAIVTDVWKAAGNDLAWTQAFLAANESSWFALAADGFLGLAFGRISVGGAATVAETLMAGGLADEPRFGIYYGALEGGAAGAGVLTLGGSREAEFLEDGEEMVEVPITRVDGGYDVWRSILIGVNGSFTGADGARVESATDFDQGNVVFDTGSPSIMLPAAQNEAVYASIGWNYSAILEGSRIPLCSEFNSSWSVDFILGDYRSPVVVTVTGDQLARPGFAYRDDACWPPFEGGKVRGFSLVGTPLLRNFYTVWDYGVYATEEWRYDPKLKLGRIKSRKSCGRGKRQA